MISISLLKGTPPLSLSDCVASVDSPPSGNRNTFQLPTTYDKGVSDEV